VKYHLLAPLLLLEVQQQRGELEEKDRELQRLNKRMEALEALVGRLTGE
jgi:hypothetical protein